MEKEKVLALVRELLYPNQIALATSIDKDGTPNIITLAWNMRTSDEPPMIAISVGKSRYSHKLISECGEFVLAFPGEEMQKAAIYCGTHSGRNVDKFKESGLKAEKAESVRPPLIAGCIANFECVVASSLDTGDHTIFVGEIRKASSSGKKKLLLELDNDRIGCANEF